MVILAIPSALWYLISVNSPASCQSMLVIPEIIGFGGNPAARRGTPPEPRDGRCVPLRGRRRRSRSDSSSPCGSRSRRTSRPSLRDGEGGYPEPRELLPQGWLAARPHPPQRTRQLARVVASPGVDERLHHPLAPRERGEERLPVPAHEKTVEVTGLQLTRPPLVGLPP